MNSKIKIGIATEQQINREFIDAWKRAENKEIAEAEEILYFLDAKSLLRVLSDKRLTLLKTLRHSGTMNIKELSRLINRSYRSLYDDVQVLKEVGLIRQTDSKKIYVPWNRIQTEIVIEG